VSNSGCLRVYHQAYSVCGVHRGGSKGGRPHGDPYANARLIAAAPDLLAELDCRVGDLVMLRRAVEASDPRAELIFRIDDMLRESRVAIAKATGGA
jgi:hypothetical protein